MLRTADMGTKGEFLPVLTQIPNEFKDITNSFGIPDLFNDFKHPSLFAGDTRVMENMVLTTWHTMFLRLHNVFVNELKEIDPSLSNEFMFNEAWDRNISDIIFFSNILSTFYFYVPI